MLASPRSVAGDTPQPLLDAVFPAGGRAGTTVALTVQGAGLDEDSVLGVRLDLPGTTARRIAYKGAPESAPKHPGFLLTLPDGAAPGVYDLQVLTKGGLSSPRLFAVSERAETVETEPNNDATHALRQATVRLAALPGDTGLRGGTVINGRLDSAGDVDVHAFELPAGSTVVLECWARRLDSKMRAVLELRDVEGRRLHPRQERIGGDPLLIFTAPVDGRYLLTVRDLTYSSGPEHFYRLALDTGPRALFSVPCVVEAERQSKVTLYGWNLPAAGPTGSVATVAFENEHEKPSALETAHFYERIEVTVDAPALDAPLSGASLRPEQASVRAFLYHLPGASTPVTIGLSDVPVVEVDNTRRDATSALSIEIPCEVSGQLVAGGAQHWLAIEARRGEVFWLEGSSARIDSPVDLEIHILDTAGRNILARFSDSVNDTGAPLFPLSHSDPAGRWVAPDDGRYLVTVHNALGDARAAPRRVYHLSIRREDPDFHVVAVPRRSPGSCNIPEGGRELMELFVLRSRGVSGPIHVRLSGTPEGVETPGTWIHPNVDRAPLVLSAARGGGETSLRHIDLIAEAHVGGRNVVRRVRGGTRVRAGTPHELARMTGRLAAGLTAAEPLRLTARYTQTPDSLGNPVRTHEVPHVSQGSVLTLAVDTEWHNTTQNSATGARAVEFRLTGVDLPPTVAQSYATIAPGETRGAIAFYLPPTLPAGPYTIAVRGEGTIPIFEAGDKNTGGKKTGEKSVVLYTNTLSLIVYPAPFIVEIDPHSPRQIRRGEVVQVQYTAKRRNGFIGKIHTEMLAPGGLKGLRGRGVTFVSQSEGGNIQIIASDDAPLGRRPFLRFEGAGYVEDEVLYLGSQLVDLEVVE